MNKPMEDCQCLLRKALAANAVFSVVSGVAILFANRWLANFLGLSGKVSLIVLGVSLIAYAGVLWQNARRRIIEVADAWTAVILDAVWVVGSYVLIAVVPFSVSGKWAIALVAEVVMAFAVLQWLGIRRMRKSEQYA
jgi:hypothetical protein